jgi:hypothetical protein
VPNATVDVAITLKDPPDFDREIVPAGSLYKHDSETFSDDNHTSRLYYDGIFLGLLARTPKSTTGRATAISCASIWASRWIGSFQETLRVR